MNDDQRSDSPIENTPGQGRTPEPERIEPAAPEEFGLVQVWWGDGEREKRPRHSAWGCAPRTTATAFTCSSS